MISSMRLRMVEHDKYRNMHVDKYGDNRSRRSIVDSALTC